MPGKKYGMKKKKAVKKPKMVKPRDGHENAMKFMRSVKKALRVYGKK